MKKGRAPIESLVVHCPVRAAAAVVGGERGSSLYRLLGEDKADWGSLRWRISLRAVGRPGVGGASGSEGLVAAEHVPDHLGEAAGEVDLGD
jgi:hypothetical protein